MLKIFIIILTFPFIIEATEFQVDKSKDNIVKITSETSLESFEGVTEDIDGYLFYESETSLQNSKIYFEINLNTLDTGIGLRNRHMRENYLETNKYKFTYFDAKVSKITKISSGEYIIEGTGTIFIHGVYKQIVLSGTLKQISDYFALATNFNIKLSDFNISIPKMMFLKLNELINISINVMLKEIK
ncbi:MAG: YceI family protein [bacterium]